MAARMSGDNRTGTVTGPAANAVTDTTKNAAADAGDICSSRVSAATGSRHDLCAPLGLPPASLYTSRRLPEVLPALSACLGHPVPTRIVPDPSAARKDLGLPGARSVIVALIDGLGYWNLALREGHAPYLRSLMGDGTWIRTCYPTTTTAAMATFGTGTCPGLTGLLGYTQLNPANGRIAQMIQWTDAPEPADLQREPTVFSALVAQEVRTDSVSLPQFKNSPMTAASLSGPRFLRRRTPQQRLDLAISLSQQPGLTYFYLRDVDHAGHNHGWESEEWAEALEDVDDQLRRLHEQSAPGTLLVIVADHGMVAADPSKRIDIAADERLSRGVRAVGGEPRAVMVYAEEETDTEELADRWRAALDGRARVLTRQEAVRAGLFGPVAERIRPMIGDLVVMADGNTTIVDSRVQSEGAMSMPGVHGSWTEMESRIPLLVDVS